jgi:signal transduction histidine kinase
VSSAFHATLRTSTPEPVAIYAEALDLSRFHSPQHQENFRRYLREKYRENNIGVIVAVGPLALEFMLGTRLELWSMVPVVFSTVDESTVANLKLPPDITGSTIQLTLRDMVAMARVLVPNLQRFALVGEPLEGTSVYRNFKQELPLFTGALEFIDLTGLPMTEVKKRVATLPKNTAILYTAIFVDGAGVAFDPTDALAAIAEVANRPIVISTETQLGSGAVGGLILKPGLVGDDVARFTLRILNGESVANIPVVRGDYIKPMFDWRQLSRWGISESQLPLGSEIRFRQPSLWDQYRWLIIATVAVVLAQAALITWLSVERRRRRIAEIELRRRLLEVIHLDGTATAGALSASIAHELNQPLGAIQSSAEAAELYLKADPPNLERVEQILANIRRDDQRAAEIISHLRGLLKRRGAIELQEFDVNDVVRSALRILEPEALKRGVALSTNHARGSLRVRADQTHLMQVILNLAVNGMDAMQNCAPGGGKISIQTALVGNSEIEVSVCDSGMGIPTDKLNKVFDTFYTTKREGTGLGLSIARTIIETYGGRIWAENRPGGGAVFRFTLPLSKVSNA